MRYRRFSRVAGCGSGTKGTPSYTFLVRTLITLIAVLAVMVGACGDSADSDDTQAASTTAAAITTLPPVTAADDTSTVASPSAATTSEAAQSTTSTTTTTGPVETTTTFIGTAGFALTRIGFALRPHVVVTNVGSGAGEMAGYWLCADGNYYEIPTTQLAAGESVIVSFGETPPDPSIGVVEVFDGSAVMGPIDPADGEMALYRNPVFDAASEMVDYLEWGLPGHDRTSVAVTAGIWPAGGFIDSSRLTLGLQVTAPPASGPEDWFAEIGG